MERWMDGALMMGVKVNASEQTPVQGRGTLMCWVRIQTQNFAVSKYVLPPCPLCEAKGHLMGAHVVRGRGVCQQF